MKRELLADIAEDFAAKDVVGEKANADYMEMLKYYPENDPDEFNNGWCCAFVYYCCREAGIDLPLGTHKTARPSQFRWFTSCIAWFEWAQSNNFLHIECSDFTPRRGDIVIYNNIISEPYKQKDSLWCDHLGIVLSCTTEYLTAAEGNVGNNNVSGIMDRKRDDTIGCYIRIPEDYVSDEYINIPDNVYFILGSGKTTVANELARRFRCYVYHTDDSRSKHFENADPLIHTALCRNVPDYWALDPEDARQWEHDIVRETTPRIITELTELATQHKTVICEGDIDVDLIAPLTARIVVISNHGKEYDFFDRPEQRHMLDGIQNRTDLSEAEKVWRIQNAYKIIDGENATDKPRVVTQLGVKEIIRNNNTTVQQTADEIAAYFRFTIWYHGSPHELSELAVGSTITRWRELAEAFSHKPQMLSYEKVGGSMIHNGKLPGFLYAVDEPVIEDKDIYRHPRTTMDNGVEWLTKRPLQVRKISITKTPMSYDEFLSFRNVTIRDRNHERIVRMFYPFLTSVCGVPEALSKIMGMILSVDFSKTSIATGCFNCNPEGNAAPYKITPDLYCRWDNNVQLYIYGAVPECELMALKDNEYVLFVLSDIITTDIVRTAGRYVYMRGNV